ncbi:MAG: hypothetical protein ACOZQL_10385 [Myxococcota bacterium]
MRALPFAVALALSSACASLSPRFEQDVATTFAQDDMRRLETDDLELYYPAQYADAAKRVAARSAECLRLLRAKGIHPKDRGRALLFLTSANYNNAYVGGQSASEPLHSLNPITASAELFHLFGLGGANAGDISCHEMFHYAHYEQAGGFWNVVNTIFGPVLPPQAFLERWFTEGVAQYYEGRLGRAVGRPFSPFYRGSFDSFVALRGGHVGPGDLHVSQRELNPFSGAYLTGLHFIEWLVAKYGEEKLWELMDVQGRSVFSPFGATLRAKKVYGLSIGALVDEWEKELAATLVVRQRPASQRVLLEDVGQLARLATHPASGTIAVVSSGNEQVPYLRILERDGRVRAENRLVRVAPGREWVYAGPGSMSGLSFTADGRWLYLLNDDLIARGDTRTQLWKIDAQTAEVVEVQQDLGRGMVGSVSADGRSYTFVDFPPEGHARLIERDLVTKAHTVLAEFPLEVSVSSPAWNPAHTRLVYSRQDANGWNLVLREADGSSVELTTDGAFNYGARWVDDTHLVFARTAGKYLQAWRLDVTNPTALERLSDSPYGLLDPSPGANGELVFAARDGVHWSIDRVGGEPLEQVALTPSEVPAWHVTPPLEVKQDEAYSSLDHLFVPQMRVPGVNVSTDANDNLVVLGALSLLGRDRLGKHTWAINGQLGLPNYRINQLSLGYLNYALAPWSIVLSGSRTATESDAFWTGGISVGRSIFSVPISFGVRTEVWEPFGQATEKFLGPTAAFSWAAGDSTAYAGTQRYFSFDFDVAGYPKAIGSDRDMVDLRGQVGVAVPLPLSKRHSFFMSATGRSLLGAPTGALRVGGVPTWTNLVEVGSRAAFPTGPGVFLPGTLVEGVRGFDDFAVRAQHAAIFSARYRYAFVIDRGFASLLWLFPSIFFRQIDVEVFGSGAVTEATSLKAVGGSVAIRTSFAGYLPVSLRYQFAWRFDFGLPPLHVVALSFD